MWLQASVFSEELVVCVERSGDGIALKLGNTDKQAIVLWSEVVSESAWYITVYFFREVPLEGYLEKQNQTANPFVFMLLAVMSSAKTMV